MTLKIERVNEATALNLYIAPHQEQLKKVDTLYNFSDHEYVILVFLMGGE